jgi:hypothetical protein
MRGRGAPLAKNFTIPGVSSTFALETSILRREDKKDGVALAPERCGDYGPPPLIRQESVQ